MLKAGIRVSLLLAAVGITCIGNVAQAQGCVAAHSNQRVIDGLMDMNTGRRGVADVAA